MKENSKTNTFMGIDLLRISVNLFNNCNETFNQKFTMEELCKITKAHLNSKWDIYPDEWSEEQIKAALENGTSPDWIETTSGRLIARTNDSDWTPEKLKTAATSGTQAEKVQLLKEIGILTPLGTLADAKNWGTVSRTPDLDDEDRDKE